MTGPNTLKKVLQILTVSSTIYLVVKMNPDYVNSKAHAAKSKLIELIRSGRGGNGTGGGSPTPAGAASSKGSKDKEMDIGTWNIPR